MRRIRITFTTRPRLVHSLTHEVLVPLELSPDEVDEFLTNRLNQEISEFISMDGDRLVVDQIILMIDLENFGTVD